MSEKMTVLNIRISLDEKNEIKDRAEKEGLSVSSYARNLLFSEDNTEDTVVIPFRLIMRWRLMPQRVSIPPTASKDVPR